MLSFPFYDARVDIVSGRPQRPALLIYSDELRFDMWVSFAKLDLMYRRGFHFFINTQFQQGKKKNTAIDKQIDIILNCF